MLQKQTSGGSSDSDDGYSYGSGRRLRNASLTQARHSGLKGRMILKPSNPEYSDILLQEIARLSEQQRREAAALATLSSSQSPDAIPSTSRNVSEQVESHSSTLDNNQLMDLDSISNQYNTNSVLPLRLPNDNRGNPAPNSHHLTGTISQINLMRARPSSSSDNTQPPFATNHDFSYPMMLQRDTHSSCLAEYQIGTHRVVGFTVGGEPRLCLPQLKALVMPECNGLDNLMSDLQISTINASSEQLNQLIKANALPKTIGCCPLITRSNAERLINYCVVKEIRPLCGIGDVDQLLDPSIREALQEETVHICDWGFDSTNWKFYINLSEGSGGNTQAEERFRQLLSFPYDQIPTTSHSAFDSLMVNHSSSAGVLN